LHNTSWESFELLDRSFEQHTTPWGTRQQFANCFCRRVVYRPHAG